MADRSVFISCSTDVEKEFGSLIRYGLTSHGLGVFPAIQKLQAGDPRSVISSASVWVVVFSKQYPESAACLNVLLWMVQTKVSKIIPIFCDVQPWELRSVDDGAYARALQDHKVNGVTAEVVHEWRAALSKVSEICGLVFDTKKDYYGECLKQIVNTVLDRVGGEQLYEGTYSVGLDQRAHNFEVTNRGIKVVGLVGPAGSGKSRLAIRLYNNYSKCSRFKRRCFLYDVSKRKNLASLQENLCKDLLLDRDLTIQDTRRGRSILKHRLQDLSDVLIVFDGMEKQEEIDNLLFVKDIVGDNSLILVTSSNRSLLVRSDVELYNVELLDEKEAQELVCWHAFNQNRPVQGFENVVEKSVTLCGGDPSHLELLVRKLCHENDPSGWEQQLKNIGKQQPNNWWTGFWKDRMAVVIKVFIFAATVVGFLKGRMAVVIKVFIFAAAVVGFAIIWRRFRVQGSRLNDLNESDFQCYIYSIINASCLKVESQSESITGKFYLQPLTMRRRLP